MRCESVLSEHDSEGDEEIRILKNKIHARKKTLQKQRAANFNSHSDGTKSLSFKTSSTVSSSDSPQSSTVGKLSLVYNLLI